jgi:hypothetical protein
MRFLPLAAIYWLCRLAGRDFADRTATRLLRWIGFRAYRKAFGGATDLRTIKHAHYAAWSRSRQHVLVEEDLDNTFAFRVVYCDFVRVFRKLGIGHLASVLCEIDRQWWTEHVPEGVSFGKVGLTLANSDLDCFTIFHKEKRSEQVR